MSNNLVCTDIEETYSKESKNVILGDWCLSNVNKNIKKDVKKIKFHWSSSKKKEVDYIYLEKLYYKILKSFMKSLNNYHSVDKNYRYWHIIIGPFLLNTLQIIWERWESFKNAIEQEQIDETRILDLKLEDITPSQFKELFFEKNSHLLNHVFYSEIIKFLKPKNIDIINLKYNKKFIYQYSNSYFNNIKKKKLNLIKFFFDFSAGKVFKNHNVLFYKSYLEKKKLIKLCFKLKQFPRIFNELDQNLIFENSLDRKNFLINFNEENLFEIFFKKILFKITPFSYLEDYKKILYETNKIKTNPKIIYTAQGHTSDDFFKIWAAGKVENGTKYIVTDHGGFLDDKQNFGSWSNYSDMYIRWNKSDEIKTKQMSPSIMFKNYKNYDQNKNSKILMIAGFSNIYPNKIQSAPVSGEIIKDIKDWEKFYSKLEDDKKKLFKIRIHPNDSWEIKKYLIKNCGDKTISKVKDFKKDVENSKIIINTNFSTSFFETMHSGIPNIVLAKQNYFLLRADKYELINEMKENKLLFENVEDALAHINEIWRQPIKWWNSDKVISTKEKFNKLCFIKNHNEINEWKNFFQSQL